MIACINSCSYLACSLDLASNSITLKDATVFQIPAGDYVYLRICDGVNEEVVRYNGGFISGNVLTVNRGEAGTERKTFAKNASVCATYTKCSIINEMIQNAINNIVLTGADIRPLNNLWTGTNSFQNTVSIFQTEITNPVVDNNPRLLVFDTGIYAVEGGYNLPTGIAYGAGLGVFRTGGTNFTVGAQIAGLHNDLSGASSDTWGVACEGVQMAGSFGAAQGIEATARNETHNNTGNKFGVYSTFKNRADGVASVPVLGANQYNLNSYGVRIDSQPRSSIGEFCGWNVGISFTATSLDEAQGGVLATGIDFSEIPNGNLSRINDWIRLRGTKGIEWNGDAGAYTPIKTLFDPAFNSPAPFVSSGIWRLENSGQLRFGVMIGDGIPFFAGNLPSPLVTNSAGAATGDFMTINLNGNYYKLELLAV